MNNLSRKLIVPVAAVAAFAGGLFWNGETAIDNGLVSSAEARVGRPLTPMSYAGVARRTTRRAAYAGAYAGAYAYPGAVAAAPVAPVVPPAGVVTALPGGCARADAAGGVYYQCGAARYQPYYYGTTLVYRPM